MVYKSATGCFDYEALKGGFRTAVCGLMQASSDFLGLGRDYCNILMQSIIPHRSIPLDCQTLKGISDIYVSVLWAYWPSHGEDVAPKKYCLSYCILNQVQYLH
jgi:hypothetical protein